MRRLMRGLLKLAGWGPFWAIVVVTALLGSVWVHIRLPLARRVARDLLVAVASPAMRGELAIARLEEINLDRIVGRHVELFDGDGHRVISAGKVVAIPDLDALRQGILRFERVVISDATVRLIDAGDGLPTLFAAFDAPLAELAEDAGAGVDVHVIVDDMVLDGITMYGDLLGLENLRAEDLHAAGKLEVHGEVEVEIRHASATLVEPFDFDATLRDLRGTISTDTARGVALKVTGERGRERADVEVGYARPQGKPGADSELSLIIDAQPVSPATLEGVGFDWITTVRSELRGRFKMHGPIDDLRMEGELDTQGGHASLDGTLSQTEGIRVRVAGEDVRIAETLNGMPDLTVTGAVQISTSPQTPGQQPPRPRIALDIKPVRFKGLVVPGFQLEGILDEGQLTIEDIKARQLGGTLSGHGMVASDGRIDLTVRARIHDIGADPNLRKLMPEARGGLNADVHLSTPELGKRDIDFHGSIVLVNARYGILHAKRLALTGSVRGDPDLPNLNVKAEGVDVRLAEYTLGDANLRLVGGPRHYKATGQFQKAGERTFHLEAGVEADRKGFVVNADPIEFAVGKSSWRGAIQGLRVTHDRSVSVDKLRLANRSQRLEATGEILFRGEDRLDAQLQDFDLAAVHALLGDRFYLKQGRADATVELRGDLSNPTLMVQGALRQGELMTLKDVNALYFVTYERGQLQLDGELDLGARGLVNLNGTGIIDVALPTLGEALEQGQYNLSLVAERMDVKLSPRLAELGMQGHIGGNLTFRGSLGDPRFDGNLTLGGLAGPNTTPIDGEAIVGYDGIHLASRAALRDPQGELGEVTARMNLHWGDLLDRPDTFTRTLLAGPWHISGHSAARSLSTMPEPLRSAAPYPLILETKFDMIKQGGITEGSVDFTATWPEALAHTSCVTDLKPRVTGVLTLRNERSLFTATGLLGNTQFADIEASMDTPVERWIHEGRFTQPQDFDMDAQLQILEMERFPWLCEYGHGQISAVLDVNDVFTEAPSANVSITTNFVPQSRRSAARGTQGAGRPGRGARRGTDAGRRGRLSRPCSTLPVTMQLDFSADASRATTSGTIGGCGGGDATLSGKIPVDWQRWGVAPAPSDRGHMELLVSLDRTQLSPLMQEIPGLQQFQALASGQLTLSGPVDDVRFDGGLNVQDGSARIVATGQDVENISAAFGFRGDWAKLEQFSATVGEGEMVASGGVGFDGFVPRRLNVAARVNQLPVQQEGSDLAWLTGSAAFDADISPKRTRTAVQIHELDMKLPDITSRAIQSLDPHPDVIVSTRDAVVVEAPYPVEFQIDASRGVTIRRNDLNARVRAELAISHQSPDTFVGGYVEFLKGDFEVYGKQFEISGGSLSFDGSADLNPGVNVTAIHEPPSGGVSPVTVTVTGTMQEPEVVFASDGCPGDAGAVAVLINGFCPDDPSATQESQGERSLYSAGITGALAGVAPGLALESDDTRTSVRLGDFLDESLIPKFMRPFIRRVYVQGGYAEQGTVATGEGETLEEDAGQTSLDALIKLYFPNSLVGTGRFGTYSWGVDVTWEP